MVEEKEKEKGKKMTSPKGITSYYEQVSAPANSPVSWCPNDKKSSLGPFAIACLIPFLDPGGIDIISRQNLCACKTYMFTSIHESLLFYQ
jgi:hypothetical protein